MVSDKEQLHETSVKLMGFWLTMAIILILIGMGLRYMFATADDAAYVSMDVVKSSFQERAQAVHVYWINNGKQKIQYLDVVDSKEGKMRIAYELSESGWPKDARIITKDIVTYGMRPCERLLEMVVPEHTSEIIMKMSSKVVNYENGCIFLVNDNKLKYSFLTGELSLADLLPERNENNVYFKK